MRDGTKRILVAFSRADDRSFAEGLTWYPVARDLAIELAGDVTEGAGVIAALSPQVSWERNIDLARDAYHDYWHGQVYNAIWKARRIITGADPDEVLPRGKKTWCFYHTIADPSSRHVVIDRHACAIAEGVPVRCDPGRIGVVRYHERAADYLAAADYLGRPVSEVQAVTWCARRNTHVSTLSNTVHTTLTSGEST